MIMIERRVTLPTIGLIAGTRAALGVGLGLIVADRLSPEMRRAAGWALVAIGALTTFPLVAEVLGSKRSTSQMAKTDLRVRQDSISPYVTTS
jgi:hypothetical protein